MRINWPGPGNVILRSDSSPWRVAPHCLIVELALLYDYKNADMTN